MLVNKKNINIFSPIRDVNEFAIIKNIKSFKSDILYICEEDEINEIYKRLIFFSNENILNEYKFLKFEPWDTESYDHSSPKEEISYSRIKALYKIINRKSNEKIFLVTSPKALIQKIVPKKLIEISGLLIEKNNLISLKNITNFLINNNYQRMSIASSPGEFAIRGDIVDIVTLSDANNEITGYRIDLDGDEIEKIRIYDIKTQLTIEEARNIEILPYKEIILSEENIENFRKNYRKIFENNFHIEDEFYKSVSEAIYPQAIENYLPLFYEEKLVNLAEYLSVPTIIFSENLPLQIKNLYQNADKKFEDNIAQKIGRNLLEPNMLYFNDKEISEFIKIHNNICFNFTTSDQIDNILINNYQSVPNFRENSKILGKDCIELLDEYINNSSKIILIACHDQYALEKIKEFLSEKQIKSHEIKNFNECNKIKKNVIYLTNLTIESGFQGEDLILISDKLIIENLSKLRKDLSNYSRKIVEESIQIEKGDLIVHKNYGIGRFDGIETVSYKLLDEEIKNDFYKIIYADNNNLFVPIYDINLISKYGSEHAELSKLGSKSWSEKKKTARKKIKVEAQELIKIAAMRKAIKTNSFKLNENLYHEFVAKFNYTETEDQRQAIYDVISDLSKETPMDRLICGDVGFGKTEVAMRAAFIVSADKFLNKEKNHQVAIITPTTILCRQHFHNFQKRFEGFDIKIAEISRMVSAGEAKKIRDGIKNGKIDIIIGTHALLNKNIDFNNLSLLIIDEEQHFGVAQKEKIKQIRNNIHVLTLSATPIPRTLQMSLLGVKDLSIIATPPVNRTAIKNHTMSFDMKIVKEAILREYHRNGQVFFIVPRIKYIDEIEKKIKKYLPDLKYEIAHGQMPPSKIDDIMNQLYDNKIDILISTSIIESGIDIKSANTIIIYKAEMFGLAQLYQLRGRVGRGKIRAYAYFMTTSEHIKKDSKSKLQIMDSMDRLGVGFSIATHDMDIRGSGNLLSEEQSGHSKDLGIEYYQKLLIEEVEKLTKSNIDTTDKLALMDEEIEEDNFDCKISTNNSLLIPSNYISDLSLRMYFYKKISNINCEIEISNLIQELNDRFGKVPEEIIYLIKISIIKKMAKKIGIEVIDIKENMANITFSLKYFKAIDKLLEIVKTGCVKFSDINQKISNKAILKFKSNDFIGKYSEVKHFLEQLL